MNQSTSQRINRNTGIPRNPQSTIRNGALGRLGKIGNDGFFKMGEKMTSKYANPYRPRIYEFWKLSQLFPFVPNRSHSFRIVPNRSQSFRIVPNRSESFRIGPFRSLTDRQTPRPRYPTIISKSVNSYGFSLGALTVTVSILPPSVLVLLSANMIFTWLSGCPIFTLKTLSAGLVIVVSGALSKS